MSTSLWMDMLGRAVSANLAFKMTALLEEPKDHKAWLHKAGQFYNADIQMKKLQGGTNYIPTSSGSKKTSQDPNAMEVNLIYLILVQWAEHIQNNKCFICHKVGCSTNNHPRLWKPSGFHTFLLQNHFWSPQNPTNQQGGLLLEIMHTNWNLTNQEIPHSMQILLDETLDETGEQINMLWPEEKPTIDQLG